MNKDNFIKKLNNGLEEMGLKTGQDIQEKLWIYLSFLLEENKKYNLTAIDQGEEIISKHFLDSLALFQKITIRENASLIDIGTGAGFPGMVLKIFRPDLQILLLDSLAKRINFLNELINKLKLKNIGAIHDRAEDLAHQQEYREKYDIAVSRAVAPINILSEYTIPFVNPGGKIVFYKGPDYQEELVQGKNAIEVLGGKALENYEVIIPNLEGERFLLEIYKEDNTNSKYPRRAGIPKKRPL